ncbi:MAG TPA: SusC/RagA family TonB-linked outer membrane protein [Flavobacterium sp.]|nr:SusC/RagA family TonB-linked outer membrane protein [Flavobacterium sp.]
MKNNSYFKRNSRLCCIIVLQLLCLPAFALSTVASQVQQQSITGTISDASGALPGVSITIKGTTKGTLSDLNGHYSINANQTDVLVFSFVGYKSLEIPVSDNLQIDVLLEQDSLQIDEVVINAGYYSVKDRERTGSIARITAKDIEGQPVTNVLAAMQGRMPGVNITQTTGVPGGGFEIQIRGANSLRTEGNYPLYIIDGVPIMAQSPSTLSGAILPNNSINPLSSININDIESIEVLKDADATAIYGSRGANGVVLITTKKGKNDKTSFSLNTSYGLSSVASSMKLMNTEQYLNMRSQAFENDGVTEYPFYAYDINGDWSSERNTNWQKELIGRTAINSTTQLSISGGGETTRFMVSGSHNKQTTVFNDDFAYKSNNLAASVAHSSKDNKFAFNMSNLFTAQSNNVINEDLTLQSLMLSPNAPTLYNEDGSLNWENNTFTNPVASFVSTYSNNTKSFNTNLNLDYKLLSSLSIKLNGGVNYSTFEELSLRPSTMYNPAYGLTAANSMAFKGNNQRFSYIIEPQLNYRYAIHQHKFDVLIGSTYQQTVSSVLGLQGYGFQSNALITNLTAANTLIMSQDDETEYNYISLFSRINYQYNDKYILNLTARRDGSSRFGPNKRFAYFGAIGAAWIFSDEDFLKDENWLSFGKLRGSYGITGSDLIGDYQYLDSYTQSGSSYGDISGMIPSQLYNSNFSWEKTEKTEVALDLGFIKDRINISIAGYYNRSGNQLVGIPLPGTTGFNSVQSNLPAIIENRGLELDIKTTPILLNHFRWDSGFNISFPKNKLVSFPDLEGSTYSNRYVLGLPTNIVKVYNYEGIDPDTGLYVFTDYNADGKITSPDDNKVIEEIGVKYYGGWSNQLTYKQWNVTFLFQFVNQRQWNFNNMMATPGTMSNQPIEVLNVWSASNPNGQYMPYSSGLDPMKSELHGYFSNSTAAIGDASYIRLKNIQLSYRFTDISLFKDILIYFQGQNLLTLTNYYGLDPEFAMSGYLPPMQTYSFGVQFNF